ncbi:hypothetical protein ACE3NQ_08610 [Paenibacillus terreus]|uniref:Uncharacterized protein n=1 Tax=Paenibacillus terreus TaxID=1387834 RepID=A0ABV5B5K3_9BACL
MEKHVVYFYYTIGERSGRIISDSFFVLDSYPVAGLTNPSDSKKINLNLRPFELQQNNLYSLISHCEELNIQILKVEFDDIDFELEEELKEVLSERPSYLFELTNVIRSENIDIRAITFNYNDRQYRVTKYAVAEIIGDWDEIPFLTLNTPLAMVTGLKKFPDEGTFRH